MLVLFDYFICEVVAGLLTADREPFYTCVFVVAALFTKWLKRIHNLQLSKHAGRFVQVYGQPCPEPTVDYF